MGAGPIFKDAADYHDWWFFSGTALGGASAGETYKKLHEQLSEAGANTVIAARFLDENKRGIDLALWRRAFVFGHVGLQVSLTLRALEAIGAVGVAQALRTAPPQRSVFSRAQEIAQAADRDPDAVANLIKELRENIAVSAAHLLGGVPQGLHPSIPPPNPPEGAESVEEVRRLLDAYVAAHRDDLARDVARHGDPRKRPGFDPDRATDDRSNQVQRLNYLSYQRNAIDGLRENLGKLRGLAARERPESPRLNKALRKVLDDYDQFARHPPEDLTPEVEAWLRDFERFRADHPEVLAPRASQSDRVLARLAAIGDHEVEYDDDAPTVFWRQPAGLPCDWTRLGLLFRIVLDPRPDPARVDSALDALCDAYDRLVARWPTLLPELTRFVVDLSRDMIPDRLDGDDLSALQGDDGALDDAKVLATVTHGTIFLTRYHDAPASIEANFRVTWEDEHPLEVPFDEDGELCRWF
ncbi:MAG TPA: hypothetical protein VG406_29230 [Isosphaeraceae bacterium]|jgi:hypothetical protein|nr:hypothetical protein [Isosphaeraceae bacterium]